MLCCVVLCCVVLCCVCCVVLCCPVFLFFFLFSFWGCHSGFGAGNTDKDHYKNKKHKHSALAQDTVYDEHLAHSAMKERKRSLVQRVPAQFVVGTFLCHLEGTQAHLVHTTHAVAGKHTVTLRKLQPRAPEFQVANVIGMHWDWGAVTIASCTVFAEGATHKVCEDGYC